MGTSATPDVRLRPPLHPIRSPARLAWKHYLEALPGVTHDRRLVFVGDNFTTEIGLSPT